MLRQGLFADPTGKSTLEVFPNQHAHSGGCWISSIESNAKRSLPSIAGWVPRTNRRISFDPAAGERFPSQQQPNAFHCQLRGLINYFWVAAKMRSCGATATYRSCIRVAILLQPPRSPLTPISSNKIFLLIIAISAYPTCPGPRAVVAKGNASSRDPKSNHSNQAE